MLQAPQFLFSWEDAAGDKGDKLDAYSKASRLSLFLWDTVPDGELLDAAASGEDVANVMSVQTAGIGDFMIENLFAA